ncbi:RNA polymerase subunit sigma [archaeon]|nr:RNA polymerase subunit sigma [archaeon]|tara:strand:- start:1557 stop:2408 length:852 start_codon:yes stop_codon:yes gene_type:complete
MKKTMEYVDGENGALKLYLDSINKIPILTAQEERDYAKKAAKGDEKAKEILINSNLRFVVSTAKKYSNCGLPFMDLIQEGNIGLMKAVEKYDVKTNYRVISYGVWWIKQTILKAISDKSREIRLPISVGADSSFIEKSYYELTDKLGRSPNKEELSEKTSIPIENIDIISRASERSISLDKPLNEESDSLVSLTPDSKYEDPSRDMLNNCFMETVFNSLSEREERIIRDYLGLNDGYPMTLQKIGEDLGLTRERIRQIRNKAIEKIKLRNNKEDLLEYLVDSR